MRHLLASFTEIPAIGLPLGITDMGPWALLILVVALVLTSLFRGWIIPKIHYDFIVKRSEAQQGTIEKQSETISVQARTIDKQTAVGDTVVRVMTAVQDSAAKSGDAG
ncbi:hypothetical protein PP641_gp037 [Arthrobacter phage SilentRX]|uniref:Uncharacterized protein n=1 Tax=Arthrobacter phage SilentRX TaxID=2836091 RepID=A0A8F3IPL9_9CAUD|nr:hypothetical protein PP641_gp037 [Arthrobacter phage SilentRX]QWY82777.1 hypothetical protein SEA_SILENTRX_37 [Arthrobacter phage SilentRX]